MPDSGPMTASEALEQVFASTATLSGLDRAATVTALRYMAGALDAAHSGGDPQVIARVGTAFLDALDRYFKVEVKGDGDPIDKLIAQISGPAVRDAEES